MNVYVVVWEHRYGEDVWVFKTHEQAQEKRISIAEAWFDSECNYLNKPQDRQELADLYFETLGLDAKNFERCSITECFLECGDE